MKNNSIFAFILFITMNLTSFAQNTPKELLYVGTFTLRGSEGIYLFDFNRETGELHLKKTYPGKESPSFLAIHPNGKFLYAVEREGTDKDDPNGTVTAFKIDPRTGLLNKLNEQSSKGEDPCHVSVDPKGRYVYVSNYGNGNMSVYPIRNDGGLGDQIQVFQHKGSSVDKDRQQGPHVHSVVPSANGKRIYCSDLGTDQITEYTISNKKPYSITETSFAESTPGAGPRHLVIDPNGKFAYSIEEMTSTIASYSINDDGKLSPLERKSTLPEGVDVPSNSGAEIDISPDGRFLYASNRGDQSLVIFAVNAGNGKLTYVTNEATHGDHPRHFIIDPSGEFVFVVNRDSDNLVVFKRDLSTGKLTYTGEARVPGAVCVLPYFPK